MECKEARKHWLDRRRGTLPNEVRMEVEAHLEGCAPCREDEAADLALTALLASRLERSRAPRDLRRSLEARWQGTPRREVPYALMGRVARTLGTLSVGAALAVLVGGGWRSKPVDDAMATESVNDYLRVVYSERPLEVQSGGVHQVKPWFEGRLDFAPVVAFSGDDEFPLQGGAVAYFMDRKAATFVFKRRLHLITLFVFRADGLPWPAFGARRVNGAPGAMKTLRGFHVLYWREGDLGYALVSDVAEGDLATLGDRIGHGT